MQKLRRIVLSRSVTLFPPKPSIAQSQILTDLFLSFHISSNQHCVIFTCPWTARQLPCWHLLKSARLKLLPVPIIYNPIGGFDFQLNFTHVILSKSGICFTVYIPTESKILNSSVKIRNSATQARPRVADLNRTIISFIMERVVGVKQFIVFCDTEPRMPPKYVELLKQEGECCRFFFYSLEIF